jgi:hypothetical protein
MMNYKGFGRKLSWTNFEVISSSGGTEGNHEKTEVRIAGLLAEI